MQKVLLIVLIILLASSSYSQKNNQSQKIRIIGNSRLAKIAAKINHQDSYAITIGRTIFISCRKEEFYSKTWWVNHELTHVAQYQKLGVLRFLSLYLYYTIFHHHTENPFEKEAEDAEYLGEVSPI